MKKLYVLIILLFTIAESFLIYYFFHNAETFKSEFWIIHFVLVCGFFILENLLKEDDVFGIFILFFPLVGFSMLLVNQFIFVKDKFHDEVESSVDLKKYLEEMEEEIIVNSSIDLNIIGAYDILSMGSLKEKKEFLIGFESTDTAFKVSVLKKALEDQDIEVIHYAATEISKIDENFLNNIKKYEIEENKEKLIKIYFNYCESGLLENEILFLYQKKCYELLKNKETLDKELSFIQMKLLEQMGDIKRCTLKIDDYLQKGDKKDIEVVEFIKKFYYEQNEFNKLKEVEQWQKSV